MKYYIILLFSLLALGTVGIAGWVFLNRPQGPDLAQSEPSAKTDAPEEHTPPSRELQSESAERPSKPLPQRTHHTDRSFPSSFPKPKQLKHAALATKFGVSEEEFLAFYDRLHNSTMSLLRDNTSIIHTASDRVTLLVSVPPETRDNIERTVGQHLSDFLGVDNIENVIKIAPELVKEIDLNMLYYGAKSIELEIVKEGSVDIPGDGIYPIYVLNQKYHEYSEDAISREALSRYIGSDLLKMRIGALGDKALDILN